MLNKDFVKTGKEPFELYPSIDKEDWEEFKRRRKSLEFKLEVIGKENWLR